MPQLAQMNIARMRTPIDHPVMKDFVDNLDRINALAEKSDGFVWRLKDDANNATAIRVFDDDFIIFNMSVWRDKASMMAFVYKTAHIDIMKRRSEWFEKMGEQYMALWYVSDGHEPTVEEAKERILHLRAHGESPHAFTFRKFFDFV